MEALVNHDEVFILADSAKPILSWKQRIELMRNQQKPIFHIDRWINLIHSNENESAFSVTRFNDDSYLCANHGFSNFPLLALHFFMVTVRFIHEMQSWNPLEL